MPEYLSPGVYVEEIDAGPKPIAAVSTSTAGMVGVTERGPTSGKPQLVTSFAEFNRVFGGFTAPPDANVVNRWAVDRAEGGRWWWFPLSVKGFFDNGGQRLYVKRVFAAASTPASAVLGQGLLADIVADAASGSNRLRLEHVFGIQEGTTLKVFNGDTGAQIGPDFNVDAYDAATNRVTLDANLPAEVIIGRGDFAEISARSATPVPANEATLAFETSSRGAWGNGYSVETRPAAEMTLNVLPDPAVGGAAPTTTVVNAPTPAAGQPWVVEVDDATGFADDDHILVNGREQVVGNLNAGNNTFEITPGLPAGDTLPAGTVVRRLRAGNAANDTTINMTAASRLYEGALIEFDNGTKKEVRTVDSVLGDTVTLSAGLAEVYFEGHRARVIGISVRVLEPNGNIAEGFGPLRLRDDGTTNFVVTHVNALSQLVRVRTRAGFSGSDLTNFPTATTGIGAALSGGDNRLDALTPEDFVGVDAGSGNRTGIQALEDIDEISICMVPNVWSATVRSALITHCEVLKDRFAIVDPQDGLSIEGIRAFREPIDTRYAALYYPWVVVRDPLSRRDVGVAPSGHMAGIYARTDVERGVHKAPANVVIRGISRIGQDVTKREQDMLNPRGINALRAFPNLGLRVWGARTLTSDMSWKYINVRRLFLMVEESIDEGTQWVVFEPNDEPLWARVRQSVSNFLLGVWRDGALAGATPDEAFYVICDMTTMTPTDLENGILICEIGIAPVFPAEFVVFRIQQKTREAAAA
jgi:phage tail sheath protein FI